MPLRPVHALATGGRTAPAAMATASPGHGARVLGRRHQNAYRRDRCSPWLFKGACVGAWMMSVVRMIWDSGGNLSRKGTNVTVTTLATGATSPDRGRKAMPMVAGPASVHPGIVPGGELT